MEAGILDCFEPGMFLRDMVAIRCGVSPLNFNSIRLHNTINFKRFRALSLRIRYPLGSGLRVLRFAAKFDGFFDEGTRVLLEKTSLVLIDINEFAILVGDAENLINQLMRCVVGLHLYNPRVDFLLEFRSVLRCERFDFIRNAHGL